MGSRGVLTKNYFIYPETVAEYGAEIESVMTETDRAMEEASEIIAKMASVTERIPSQIRSGELLELCETAQAEIRSFDFLSYGKRVNQGLLNLLDQNQYITDNFIKKMEATTERMREFGAGCRRLTELIDYSGGSLPLKGLALSAVSNVEGENADAKEEKFFIQGQNAVLNNLYSCNEGLNEEIKIAIRLLDTQIYYKLGITDITERQNIIQGILDNKSYVFNNLYILNAKSGVDYQKQMSNILLYINYINMIDKVGEWYTSNVHTYCRLNKEEYDNVIGLQNQLRAMGIGKDDPRWISTTARGRGGYTCTLEGNLKDVMVYDDCSSFVTACLIQSGFLEEDTQWYNSYDYIGESGKAAQALRDAGFVWYPISEMVEEGQMNLQQGDIMVMQGHVQIFDHFKNEENNPLIYAYTWGHICNEEPTGSCRWEYFTGNYIGIWRLEN